MTRISIIGVLKYFLLFNVLHFTLLSNMSNKKLFSHVFINFFIFFLCNNSNTLNTKSLFLKPLEVDYYTNMKNN